MDHLGIVIMLARQRSGTNPLRSVLDTHPELFCTPEVFHERPSPEAPLEVETNFFRFLEQHPKGRACRTLSYAEQEEIFVDFMDFITSFSDKPWKIIDVKYNSTHHFSPVWKFITAEPTFFTMAKGHGCRVLNLTRRNYLRYFLSQSKANMTQAWTLAPGVKRRDTKLMVDLPELLRTLNLCRTENEVIAESFAGYWRYFTFDYEDMFPVMESGVSENVLQGIADWLQIQPDFQAQPSYEKQASLPLRETIENYDEVERALKASVFDYCLEDESMYSKQSTSAKE